MPKNVDITNLNVRKVYISLMYLKIKINEPKIIFSSLSFNKFKAKNK